MKLKLKNRSGGTVQVEIGDAGRTGGIDILRYTRYGNPDFDFHLVPDGPLYQLVAFNSRIQTHDDAFIETIDAVTFGEALDIVVNYSF